jgi:hypothetical protein
MTRRLRQSPTIREAALAAAAALLAAAGFGTKVGEAADIDNRFSVRGLGTTSCSVYLESRDNGAGESEPFAHWFTGFLTAYNWLQPDTFDISAQYKSAGLLIWLDYYCGRNPENKIIDAALTFVSTIHDQRLKAEP